MRFLSYSVALCACLLVGPSLARAEAVAQAPEREVTPVVMARVGERDITVEQFMQFLTKNPGRVHEATTPEGKGQLLRTLVEAELMRQAMLDAGSITETSTPKSSRSPSPSLPRRSSPRLPRRTRRLCVTTTSTTRTCSGFRHPCD